MSQIREIWRVRYHGSTSAQVNLVIEVDLRENTTEIGDVT